MTSPNPNEHPEAYDMTVEEQARLLVLQAEVYLATAGEGELERIRQEEALAAQEHQRVMNIADRRERFRKIGLAMIMASGRAMQYAFGPWPAGYMDIGGYEEPDT
ncbi:MAG: hypothetical protein QG553_410 [Patescibacteria group bacterium]|nr:hypothetical protein [Patescibacteria group bacterium]